MIPVEPTTEQTAYWAERDGCEQKHVVMGGPEEGPDVIPCPCLVANEVNVVHVALRLDEIEVAALAQGGTLWLSTWGGLPIHLVEVVPHAPNGSEAGHAGAHDVTRDEPGHAPVEAPEPLGER